MEFWKKFYNTIIPQYAVTEVFFASFFILVTSTLHTWNGILADREQSLESLLILAGGYICYLTFLILFPRKNIDRSKNLVIAEIAGLIFIFYINLTYIYELFFKLDLVHLTWGDYCFLIFSGIILIRFIVLTGAFTFGNRISLNFLLLPVKADFRSINPYILILILLISLFYYFWSYQNLAIATAQAFFIAIFCLDIYQIYKNIFIPASK